jgi:hypothetical protein
MHSYICHLLDDGHVQADGNMTNGDEVDDDNNQMPNEGDFTNYHFGFAFNWPLLACLGSMYYLSQEFLLLCRCRNRT